MFLSTPCYMCTDNARKRSAEGKNISSGMCKSIQDGCDLQDLNKACEMQSGVQTTTRTAITGLYKQFGRFRVRCYMAVCALNTPNRDKQSSSRSCVSTLALHTGHTQPIGQACDVKFWAELWPPRAVCPRLALAQAPLSINRRLQLSSLQSAREPNILYSVNYITTFQQIHSTGRAWRVLFQRTTLMDKSPWAAKSPIYPLPANIQTSNSFTRLLGRQPPPYTPSPNQPTPPHPTPITTNPHFCISGQIQVTNLKYPALPAKSLFQMALKWHLLNAFNTQCPGQAGPGVRLAREKSFFSKPFQKLNHFIKPNTRRSFSKRNT